MEWILNRAVRITMHCEVRYYYLGHAGHHLPAVLLRGVHLNSIQTKQGKCYLIPMMRSKE